ncbi:MAG: Uma2 family endonuclease [Acidobacteria bacterium]|nr:Uma2 family endonuclease [Acidobacteriota bacterium]
MSALPIPHLSLEAYLEIERAAVHRSEYRDGLVVSMAGGTSLHDLIIMNTGAALHSASRDLPCRVHGGNLQVYIASFNVATYPDAMVICGPTLFARRRNDLVENPSLIIEVLSPSTEAYDRGRKFEYYRALPSLREYILISQDQPQVEQFSRQPDDSWRITVHRGLSAAVTMAAINASIQLKDLYAKVEWPEEGTTPQ